MVEIVHNPWRRIGLRAVGLAVLGALLLAGSARAAEVGELVPVGETATTAPEAVLSGPAPAPAPETVLSAPGPTPSPTSSETLPTVPTTPTPSPTSSETSPTVPTTPAPAPTPAPTSSETVPTVPAPEAVLTPQETLPSLPQKTTPETTVLGATSATGKGQEAVAIGPVAGSQGNVTGAGPAIGSTPGPPGGTPPAAVVLAQVPTASSAGPRSAGGTASMTAAQRDRQFTCDLSELGEDAASNCAAGGLSAQRLLAESPAVSSGTTAASVAAAAGSPPSGGHGGPGLDSPPVNPAPGPTPAPSGASGSAAGSSGIALSGFLTLAGLLLLGAPRAMRRLRLSCQPWRTACFVLIPERPG